MADDEDATPRRGTSSDRMLSVMDLFTPEQPEWTVDEACAVLGQSESTVYRYFRSLTSAGLIFSIRPGRYLLGPGIVHYDRQLRTTDPLLRVAEPVIFELAAEYSGPGLIFVSRIHRDFVMTMHEQRLGAEVLPEGVFARGRLAPMFDGAPALGIVAFLEVRAVRAMFQRTGGDDDAWLATKRIMRVVRAQGYAVGIDDPDPGVTHVSVPLKQGGDGVAGSLTMAMATEDADAAVIARVAQRLAAAADRMDQQARRTARE